MYEESISHSPERKSMQQNQNPQQNQPQEFSHLLNHTIEKYEGIKSQCSQHGIKPDVEDVITYFKKQSHTPTDRIS